MSQRERERCETPNRPAIRVRNRFVERLLLERALLMLDSGDAEQQKAGIELLRLLLAGSAAVTD